VNGGDRLPEFLSKLAPPTSLIATDTSSKAAQRQLGPLSKWLSLSLAKFIPRNIEMGLERVAAQVFKSFTIRF